MPECQHCGESDTLARKCEYCGRNYCSRHTLPENHDCPGLHRTETLGPEFRTEDSDSIFDLSGSIGILGSEDSEEKSPKPGSTEPDYESSPDVDVDGNIVGGDSTEPARKGGFSARLKKIFAGATLGGRYRGDCPHCGTWVSQRRTDRYTRCHRCGWKAGLPVLRIVTHWPNWYLWRRRAVRWTKRSVYVSALALLLTFLIGATIGTGVSPIDDTASDFADSSGFAGFFNNSTTGLADTLSDEDAGLNRTRIEYQIHYYINQERMDRGLSRLRFDDEIHRAARYHSEDMANRTYFAHDSPEGHDFEDRYRRFGIECSVRVSSTMRSGGAENIAYTYASSDIRNDGGETINHYGNETSIARGLVTQWMNSPGHRENILKGYWRTEGIGVALAEVDGKTRVYATQNFC